MRRSLQGHRLPESFPEFQELLASGELIHKNCLSCRKPFSDTTTHSALGWAETQISGFCEDCFDNLWEDFDDKEPSHGTTT